MSNDGYASFWRQQFTNETLEEKPYCMGYAWTYLYSMANWKDGYAHFRNETIPIKRSQRVTSFSKLAIQFGWDRKKVKNFFVLLEKDQMLTYRVTNRYVIYTVCNYDSYQKRDINTPTERPTEYPTEGQQTTQQTTQQLPTNNKDNKDNKDNTSLEVLSEKDLDNAKAYLTSWNKIHSTRYRAFDALAHNLKYWMSVYPTDEILQAITNVKSDKFWEDKMGPEILLRRKNQNGEKADNIGKLLHSGRRKENVSHADKMVF